MPDALRNLDDAMLIRDPLRYTLYLQGVIGMLHCVRDDAYIVSSGKDCRLEHPDRNLAHFAFILRSNHSFILRDAASGGPQDEGMVASRRMGKVNHLQFNLL